MYPNWYAIGQIFRISFPHATIFPRDSSTMTNMTKPEGGQKI